MKNLKNNNAITLVALVITIIVLLILAGISISMVVGDNGILRQAEKAKIETTISKEEEFVNLAYSGVLTTKLDDTITKDEMQKELDKIAGNGETTVVDNGDKTLTVIFTETQNEYIVEVDVEEDMWSSIIENLPDNYEEYLEKAQELGQKEDEVNIGIGTDGEVVNLDLWYYVVAGWGDEMVLGKQGYSGYNYLGYSGKFEGGKIEGTVPQYIYVKAEDKVYPVTTLTATFYNKTELLEAPELPSTLLYIHYEAFYGCTNMKSITIPDTVIGISDSAFEDTNSLTEITFPEKMEWINFRAFNNSGLTSIIIPKKIEYIGDYAFSNCSALANVYFEHEDALPEMYVTFSKDSGEITNFYFKNETLANSFAAGTTYEGGDACSYYSADYGTISTNYDW